MQQTDYYPLIGAAVDGLVEDLNSISIRIVPGCDLGLDVEALPRPFEGVVEPNYVVENQLRYTQ